MSNWMCKWLCGTKLAADSAGVWNQCCAQLSHGCVQNHGRMPKWNQHMPKWQMAKHDGHTTKANGKGYLWSHGFEINRYEFQWFPVVSGGCPWLPVVSRGSQQSLNTNSMVFRQLDGSVWVPYGFRMVSVWDMDSRLRTHDCSRFVDSRLFW